MANTSDKGTEFPDAFFGCRRRVKSAVNIPSLAKLNVPVTLRYIVRHARAIKSPITLKNQKVVLCAATADAPDSVRIRGENPAALPTPRNPVLAAGPQGRVKRARYIRNATMLRRRYLSTAGPAAL